MILRLKNIVSNVTNNTRWIEKQQNTILSAAAVITIANIFSSVSGLLRERLLIQQYFSTPSGQQAFEAFQVAFQIPDMMFQLIILGAVSAALIPVFTKLLKSHDQEAAFQMSSTTMTWLLLIFFVASVVVAYFAHPITALRTGDQFTAEQIHVAARLTQIMLIAQFFFAISNFMTGMLQAHQRFIVPAIAPVLYNLGIIGGVFLLSNQFGIYAAGVGVIIGAFIHMLIQLPLAHKLGFRYRPRLSLKLPGIKSFMKLMPPRLLTIGVTEVQNLALGFFATSVGNLGFTLIRLALRLLTFPIRLFGVPISQASLPFLAKVASEEGLEKFTRLLIRSLNQISFFAYPASVLLLILRVPIVRLAYGTHNFPWSATITMGKVVAIMALSIGAQAMVQLLIRAFYALQDTVTPFWITVAYSASYFLFNWYFVFHTSLGIFGIAISTLLSALVELTLALIFIYKKIPSLNSHRLFVPQIKMLITSFFMAVFLYLPFRILDELVFDTTRTMELIGLTITTGTIGMTVYLYFSALFDVKQLQLFTRMLAGFGTRWRSTLLHSEEILVETSVEGDEI